MQRTGPSPYERATGLMSPRSGSQSSSWARRNCQGSKQQQHPVSQPPPLLPPLPLLRTHTHTPTPPQAGDARLTDTRADEQERGITIKSTGISLYYEMSDESLKDFKKVRTGVHTVQNRARD